MIHALLKNIFVQIASADESVQPDDKSISELLQLIAEKNESLAKKLMNFKNAYEAYHFIQSDHELRSKVKDIWEIQLHRTKRDMDETALLLIYFCRDNEISLPKNELFS
jgi:hypothetical protein